MFNTLNTVKAQAFQVYVMHEGKKFRFHMQLNSDKEFHITDRSVCPAEYLQLEAALSQAIGENTKPPVTTS